MRLFRKKNSEAKKNMPVSEGALPIEDARRKVKPVDYEFAPDDPFLDYLVDSHGVVRLDELDMESPALEFLKNIGVKVSVPLVTQGELIGLINLGPRMSEQDYSREDIRLLNSLAVQAAPAMRLAQLARQQQTEARERERMEQELRVARIIQETLLPKELPKIENWQIEATWQPAREVSGDFYDFIQFPDGKLGIVSGDATGKGVPAALVMATTRSVIRAAAERIIRPGLVLERANNILCPDMPKNMFVTCLYVLLDPISGEMVFANAGHNLPQKCTQEGSVELRARGMPLGLIPEMTFEEREAILQPGENLVMYSDGLVEAHNQRGDMFGFDRLRALISKNRSCSQLIHILMDDLENFTGPAWEREDDVNIVTLHRLNIVESLVKLTELPEDALILAEFSISSSPGNERFAMDKVVEIIQGFNFPKHKIERLKTAIAEATLNAIEHGNQYHPDIPATIKVVKTADDFRIFITDMGGGKVIPVETHPDLEAKLDGSQSPRGWGLFLIKSMADEVNFHSDDTRHTIELIFLMKDRKVSWHEDRAF